jgi:serine protease Do
VQDVSEEASEYYGIPKGAYVESTEEGGGAAAAGIQQGDIITKFDGITITSAADLGGMIAYYEKGEQVEVVYMRSNNGAYEEHTVTVTLAESKQAQESKEQERAQENPEEEPEIPEGQYPEDGFSGEYDMDEMEEFFRYFFGN